MEHEERFERIERQVEFLATNQAQLSASVSGLSQEVVELARIVQQHVIRTETRFQAVAEQLGTLGEGHRQLLEAQRRLTESQRNTEDRLNALIVVVERYFSNGKN